MDKMEFHPLADQYRLMGEDEADSLARSIEANGLRHAIVLYEGKILDGRNRYIACHIAGVEPRYRQFGDSPHDGTDPAAFVADRNDERLHDESERARKRRAARVLRVASRREAGESIPMIAEAEGVSVGQVQRDLAAASTLSGGDKVEPKSGKTTGKDGKERPAKKPAVPKKPKAEANGAHDDRADRLKVLRAGEAVPEVVALVDEGKATLEEAEEIAREFTSDAVHSYQEDVAGLVAQGRPVAEALAEVRKDAARLHDDPTDEVGVPLSKESQEAFAVRQQFREARKLFRQLAALVDAIAKAAGGVRYVHQLQRRQSTRDGQEQTRFRCQYLEDSFAALRRAMPHCSVCPWCWQESRGKPRIDCKACLGLGWVTKWDWDNAPADYRAAVEEMRREAP